MYFAIVVVRVLILSSQLTLLSNKHGLYLLCSFSFQRFFMMQPVPKMFQGAIAMRSFFHKLINFWLYVNAQLKMRKCHSQFVV